MAGRVDYGYETWSEKLKRKFNENPWVPIGCLATVGTLTMSAIKMKAGKSRDMNYWLRARVILQGLTIVALVSGAMALQSRRTMINTGVANNLPRSEATTELIREQKKGKEKAEFEDRLRAAEIAHREEQAANTQVLHDAKGYQGAASIEKPYTTQTAANADADAAEGSRSGSLWIRWFRWGSSKGGEDESSKK